MPRLNQSVPKYRKHRASKQAIVTISGRDHYFGPSNSRASKVEYDRLITEWLSSGRSPSFGATQPDLMIVELVADYLRYAKVNGALALARTFFFQTPRTASWNTMATITKPRRAEYIPTPEYIAEACAEIHQRRFAAFDA